MLLAFLTGSFFDICLVRSHALFQNEKQLDLQETAQKWALKQAIPNDLPWMVYSFPFSAPADNNMRRKLIAYLPKASVARRHCQNYFRYGAWQLVALLYSASLSFS